MFKRVQRESHSSLRLTVMGGLKHFEDWLGDIAGNDTLPALWANKTFDHTGADFSKVSRRHEESGDNFWVKIAIDVAHLFFFAVVFGRPNTTENKAGVVFFGKVDEVLKREAFDGDIVKINRGVVKHV